MIILLESIIGNTWTANVVTAGVILGAVRYFIMRMVKQYDERLEKIEEKASAADRRATEIEKNYIERFDEVKDAIHGVKDNIVEKLAQITQERHQHGEQQARWMGQIEGKLNSVLTNIRGRGRNDE